MAGQDWRADLNKAFARFDADGSGRIDRGEFDQLLDALGSPMSAQDRELGFGMIDSDEDAAVTIFATGSEVEIAVNAQKDLSTAGIAVRVVSVPSYELFEAQSDDYKAAVIGNSPVKIAVEAGIRMGWDRFIGADGIFVGMTGFGASAPYKELYEHFGITADAVVAAAKAKLSV